jgi:transcriptional regulator with PAS, ATPase and Fis domain
MTTGESRDTVAMDSAARMQLIDGTTAVICSQAMQRLMSMVERVAAHEAAVLIAGETGSGKELVARAMHECSPRNGKPFVDVNCAALPEHLVESELFGYEKGAFSGADSTKPGLFEVANHGTIFLDEIGELDPKIQAKLLRVLDGAAYYRLGGSRKVDVDVRVIAATNRDLEQEVNAGKFRGDLYHRLAQFHLQVPPLRERIEDISALAEYFLQKQCTGANFTPDAIEALEHYSWPGNVRELKNVIFKIAVNARQGKQEFRAIDLPAVICGVPDAIESGTLDGNLEDMERRMIFRAMEQSENNQKKAALQLGISTRTLRRKLEKYRAAGLDAQGRPSGKLSAQQQRYFRVMVDVPAVLKDLDEGGPAIEATVANISSGGVALKSPITLKHGSTFELNFLLPGTSTTIECKANLAWTSPGGLAGLSFLDIHPAVQKELQSWLVARVREEGWTASETIS